MVCNNGGQRGEEGGQEHTHIADVNGNVDVVHYMVEEGRGDHQTCTKKGMMCLPLQYPSMEVTDVMRLRLAWVNGPPNDPAQGVPCPVIEPVVEAVETFLCKVLGRPEVEVWIKFMNYTLKTQHSKQPG